MKKSQTDLGVGGGVKDNYVYDMFNYNKIFQLFKYSIKSLQSEKELEKDTISFLVF